MFPKVIMSIEKKAVGKLKQDLNSDHQIISRIGTLTTTWFINMFPSLVTAS